MKTIQRMFELNLTPKEVVWGKRILAVIILPVLVFYTTSMNFIFLGVMNAQAADTATVQTDNSASTPSLANTTSEPDKKVDSSSVDMGAYKAALAKVHETDYTTDSWTTYQKVVKDNEVTGDDAQKDVDAATKNIQAAQADLIKVSDLTDYKKVLSVVSEKDYTADSWTIYQAAVSANVVTDQDAQKDVDTATDKIKKAQDDLIKVATTNETTAPVVEEQGTITPQAASTEKVVIDNPIAKPEWVNSNGGKNATIGPVEQGVTYKAPQNNKVTVTFTKLPEKAGNLTIKEIKLSSEEQLAIGALSDTAYDIASDMDNGTFKYDLTLPYPDKNNDGKVETANGEVKADDLQVLYTEGNEVKKDELKNVEEDKNIGKDTNKSGKVIELKGLDHFTIFVVTSGVTDGSSSGDFCATFTGGVFGCYGTLTAAIAAAPAGSTIIINPNTYTESPTVNKDLTIELNGNVTFDGIFTVSGTSSDLTLKSHGHTLTANIITNGGVIKNATGDGNIVLVAATGNLTARTITSVGDASLTATLGNILDVTTAAQTTYITGTNITLSAPAGSIGAYDATISTISNFNKGVDVKLNGGILNATAKDDVAVTEVGSSSINSSNYNISSATAGKYVIFGSMKAGGTMTINSAFDSDALIRLVSDGAMTVDNAISTSASDLELYSKGNITLNKSLTAGTNAVVKAGFSSGIGSIIDDGNQATYVQANNIAFTATSGNIGSVTNGAVSTDFSNAVDVKLGTGSLTATATGNNVYITEIGRDNISSSPGLAHYTLSGTTKNLSVAKTFSGASSLTSPNGKVTISDTDSAGSVLITDYATTPPAGALNTGVPMGAYYEIQSSGMSFPVSIVQSYSDAEVTAALLTESQINGIYYYDGSWQMYPADHTNVNRGANTITIEADHLTPIVAGADTVPPHISSVSWNDVDHSTDISGTDSVVVTFSEAIDTTTIDTSNVSARLGLSNSHTFGTAGAGMGLAWSAGNTILTIILGTDSTVATGDTIDPISAVTDAYGNADATPSPLAITDNVKPNVLDITSTATNPTKNSPIPVAITFSENVTRLEAGDFTVTNGTAGNLSGSGENYTVDITPTANGAVTVTLGADKVQDAAGNQNNAAGTTLSRDYDTIAPTVTVGILNTGDQTPFLAGTCSDVHTVTGINVTVNSVVYPVAGADMDCAGAGTWGAQVTNDLSDGTYDVSVAATDAAGNVGNDATTNELTINHSPPVLQSFTSSSTDDEIYGIGDTINITANYNKDLLGGSSLSVVLNSGATVLLNIVSGSSISGNYVVASGDSSDDLSVSSIVSGSEDVNDLFFNWRGNSVAPAGDATNNIGGSKNIVVDGVAPTVAITDNFSGATTNGNVTFTFTFSEAVNGFTANDVVVAGGAKGAFTGVDGDLVYTLVVTPDAATQAGTITVDVAAGVAKDLALNDNTVAIRATQNYDTAAPTVVITDNFGGTTANGNVTFTFTFSEAVNGFTAADVSITGGTKGSFTGSDGVLVYTLVIAPTAVTQAGTITVNVAADVAQDAALNNNTAATQATQNYDTAAPLITITRNPDQDLYSGDYTIAVAFGDSVSGKEYSLDGGVNWTTYTVAVPVITEGAHTFDARGIDSAGNTGNATQATFTIDKTKPAIDSILAPVAETAYKADPALQFTPNDTATAVTCSYKIDGGTSVPVVCTKATPVSTTITGLTDGRHSIVITVADSAGNSLDSSAISFVYDNNSTLTVGSGKDFATIQGAINASSASDTIDVAAGTYTETVLISGKTNLIIQGVGDATLIEPAPAYRAHGFAITNSNYITIKNLKIHTNAEESHGIWVYGAAMGGSSMIGLTVQDTTIIAEGGVSGIIGDSATDAAHSGWLIHGNTITAGGDGIDLQDVTASEVGGNTITIPYLTGGTNVLWTSERYNLTNLKFNNNTVSGSGGSEVSILTDFNHPPYVPGVPVESGPVVTTISGVTFQGNTFSNWGSKAIRVGQGQTTGTLDGISGVTINSNTFQMTADTAQVIGGTAASIATGTGNTFNVNSPAKIQKAVDAAFAGDTINVAAGDYTENITINKSLTIKGAGVGTVITGNINTTGDNVTVQDLKVTNSNSHDGGASDFGIKTIAGKALTLENVTVDVLHNGVYMTGDSASATALTINHSNIKGYGAVYLNGTINSAGTSNNAVVTIHDTSLVGSTSYSGTVDDFSVLGLDYAQHVNVIFTETSSVANEYTGGAQAKERLITFWDASDNAVTGTPTYTNGHSEINDDALFVSGGYVSGYSATNTVAGKTVGRYAYDTASFEASLASGAAIPTIVGRAETPIVTTAATQTLVARAKLIIEAPDSTSVTIGAGKTLVNNGTILIESGATLTNSGTLQSISITGDAKYGQVLTAAVTGITNAGAPAYQWKRNGTNIDTATAATYTLGSADIGTVITATAIVTGITGSVTSAGTGTVANADQATLTVVATPSTVVYGATSTLSTTGGSGTGAVAYSAGGSTGCSISDSALSVTNASGTCVVTATKAADANYGSATSAALTVTLQKAEQTVTFGELFGKTYGDANFVVSATASSTSSVTFSVGGSDNCTISGVEVHITGAGSCTVTAHQVGNGNYNSAPDVPRTFSIATKLVTVTADAINKERGTADPALTYTFTPTLIGTDAFTGALTRNAGEGVGTYAITQGTVSAGTNYAITYVGKNLTISDTIAPIVAVTIGRAAFKIGESTTVTFTFSEAPTGFDAADVTVGSGTIGVVSVTGDPLVFTATYTPAVATTNAINVITVGTSWTDATNAPAESSSSANYTVDTVAPTVTVTIVSNNANANYAKVGDTITLTFAASEDLTSEPTVTIATHTIDPANVNRVGDAKHWTATYVMQATGDAEGTIPFSINYSDLAGNAGTQVTTVTSGLNVTFDKTAPSMPNYRTSEGNWYNSKPTNLDIDFLDNYMLDHVDYKLGSSGAEREVTGGNMASYTTNWALDSNDWSAMSSGSNYYLYFHLVDMAGNEYTTSDKGDGFFLRRDTNGPDAPSYNDPEGHTYTSQPTNLNIHFSDGEALEKVEYRVPGSSDNGWKTIANSISGKTYTSNWAMALSVWDGLTPGDPYYIYFRITDDVGNIYTTVDNAAGFLFYKNSGSGGIGSVQGVQNNGVASPKGAAPQGAEGTSTPQVLGEESPTGGEQATGAPAPEGAQNPWRQAIPYALGGTLLLSGIWLWIKRRGGGVGGSTPTIMGMMFSSLKTAASKIRMFLW